MNRAVMNWSGGKDSALAFYNISVEKKYDISCLLTTFSGEYNRVSMHGVRVSLIEKQAESIGVPLNKIFLPESPSMEVYEDEMGKALKELKEQHILHCIFGDIFLEDIRAYREKQLEKLLLKAVFPLWGKDTRDLATRFVDEGFKAIVVCVDDRYLDASFSGRLLDKNFIEDLPENVDPCGENGEFHSFVFDGPIFRFPVKYRVGEKVLRKYPSHNKEGNNAENGFWFCDITEE